MAVFLGRGRATRFPGRRCGTYRAAVGPLSAEQQPATKADLYAAVDALRADMRELLDEVRKLIREADRRVSDAERLTGSRLGISTTTVVTRFRPAEAGAAVAGFTPGGTMNA